MVIYLLLRYPGANVAQPAGNHPVAPRGECASGASVGEEGAEDEGQDCHTRGHLSRVHHQVAEIQAVAAPAAGRSWL